jgi:hypothetical protein
VKLPSHLVGPRVEAALWRLFDAFAGGANLKRALTNWGWAKLLRELKAESATFHPDVLFNRFAAKGRLPFDAFVQAVAELERLLAGARPGRPAQRAQLPPTAGAPFEPRRRAAQPLEPNRRLDVNAPPSHSKLMRDLSPAFQPAGRDQTSERFR